MALDGDSAQELHTKASYLDTQFLMCKSENAYFEAWLYNQVILSDKWGETSSSLVMCLCDKFGGEEECV